MTPPLPTSWGGEKDTSLMQSHWQVKNTEERKGRGCAMWPHQKEGEGKRGLADSTILMASNERKNQRALVPGIPQTELKCLYTPGESDKIKGEGGGKIYSEWFPFGRKYPGGKEKASARESSKKGHRGYPSP